MLTAKDTVKLGIPPAMRDRYIIRCTEKKFGMNSNDNPMITINWEIVGKPNTTGSVDTEIESRGKKYQIAGITVTPSYFTLISGRALTMYQEFWEKSHPSEDFPGVDETNPDIEYLDSLCMSAILSGQTIEMRKELTDEEKAAKKLAGETPVGEAITDEEGNPITRQVVKIDMFLKKYTGDIPNPY